MEYSINDRREKILELLSTEGRVEVSALSRLFGISEVMIRRDLTELEDKGLLSRVHGGAVSSYKTYYNMSLQQRSNTNIDEKKAIASFVAASISDNETILMNAGTTTLFVCRALSLKKNIKIVTNSISIALEAAGNENFGVVLLGGDINTKYQFSYGDDAMAQLDRYHFDRLILSVDGIDSVSGLTTYYNQEAPLCRKMISRATSTIVVADYTKIGRSTFAAISDLSCVDTIVTNKKVTNSVLSEIPETVNIIKV